MAKKKNKHKRKPPVAQPTGPMQLSTTPATMAEVHQINKPKETGVTNYLDQKFLNPLIVKEETLKTLAGIELQKHRLRMVLVANGNKEDTVIEGDKNVKEEIDRLDKVMEDIQKEFADVLNLKAPEPEA